MEKMNPKKGFSRCYSVDGRGLGEEKEDGTIPRFAGFFQKHGSIGKEKTRATHGLEM